MTTLDDIRTLRGTALRLLPGFWQAREHLNIAIKVLEYFAREAEHELTAGPNPTPRPIDPDAASHIRIMVAMMRTFSEIHKPRG